MDFQGARRVPEVGEEVLDGRKLLPRAGEWMPSRCAEILAFWLLSK